MKYIVLHFYGTCTCMYTCRCVECWWSSFVANKVVVNPSVCEFWWTIYMYDEDSSCLSRYLLFAIKSNHILSFSLLGPKLFQNLTCTDQIFNGYPKSLPITTRMSPSTRGKLVTHSIDCHRFISSSSSQCWRADLSVTRVLWPLLCTLRTATTKGAQSAHSKRSPRSSQG